MEYSFEGYIAALTRTGFSPSTRPLQFLATEQYQRLFEVALQTQDTDLLTQILDELPSVRMTEIAQFALEKGHAAFIHWYIHCAYPPLSATLTPELYATAEQHQCFFFLAELAAERFKLARLRGSPLIVNGDPMTQWGEQKMSSLTRAVALRFLTDPGR